jgi:uncharacterized protein YrrD
MQTRDLQLGQTVFSSDGKKLGSVDRLLVSDQEQRVDGIIIHKMLRQADRIIDIEFIDRTDQDGVHLSITADQVGELPTFVEQEYVTISPDTAIYDTYATMYGGGLGQPFVSAPVAGTRTVRATTSSFFDPAIPPGAVTEEVSSAAANEDIIASGTDVVGSDGDKVGTVHEVLFDERHQVRGIVVKSGFLFKHDVVIPMDSIAEIGSERVHLNVTGDQAEAMGQG